MSTSRSSGGLAALKVVVTTEGSPRSSMQPRQVLVLPSSAGRIGYACPRCIVGDVQRSLLVGERRLHRRRRQRAFSAGAIVGDGLDRCGPAGGELTGVGGIGGPCGMSRLRVAGGLRHGGGGADRRCAVTGVRSLDPGLIIPVAGGEIVSRQQRPGVDRAAIGNEAKSEMRRCIGLRCQRRVEA